MSEDSGGGWGIGSETWHIIVGMLVLIAVAIYMYVNGGLENSIPKQELPTIAPQVIQ